MLAVKTSFPKRLWSKRSGQNVRGKNVLVQRLWSKCSGPNVRGQNILVQMSVVKTFWSKRL